MQLTKLFRQGVLQLTLVSLATPFIAGCGASTQDTSKLPAVDDSARQPATTAAPVAKKGMSTGEKVVILAGAAALYYMYKKNQEKHQSGGAQGDPQYYLSKNGRVYYREKGGRVHWVTPPAEGIQVPQSEASQYEQLQGYDGRTTGKDLAGIGNE